MPSQCTQCFATTLRKNQCQSFIMIQLAWTKEYFHPKQSQEHCLEWEYFRQILGKRYISWKNQHKGGGTLDFFLFWQVVAVILTDFFFLHKTVKYYQEWKYLGRLFPREKVFYAFGFQFSSSLLHWSNRKYMKDWRL